MSTYKSKQYLFVLLKVIVVIAAFGFIYHRISTQEIFTLGGFMENFWSSSLFQIENMIVLVALSFLNWLFEILKWQVLVSKLKKISLPESTKQVLTAHTSSIFTPFKMGEYGAKTLFYGRNQAKKVVFLNFLGNMAQLCATLLFGFLGLFFFIKWNFPQWLEGYLLFMGLGLLSLFFGKRQISGSTSKIKGFSLQKITDFIRSIPKTARMKILLFSGARYVFFSFQFCFLLSLLSPVSWIETLPLVFVMYLFSSALPVLQLFDFAVKGGVAVLVFSAIPAQIVVLTAFMMWFLNVMLPALLGSYFVLSFDTKNFAKTVTK
ncbi:MAG: hypothetical protein NXH73_02350 [Flavobacteriaceae bacterium]|nr:hypothetical protein [Flavobacteriaceae bacterium]